MSLIKYEVTNNGNKVGYFLVNTTCNEYIDQMKGVIKLGNSRQDIYISSNKENFTLIEESIDNFTNEFRISNLSSNIDSNNKINFSRNNEIEKMFLFNNRVFSNVYLISNLPKVFDKYSEGNDTLKLYTINSILKDIYPTTVKRIASDDDICFEILFPENSICRYDKKTKILKEYNSLDNMTKYDLLLEESEI